MAGTRYNTCMITTTKGAARRPQPPIGFLLRKLDRLINERFERTLGARGVTRRQWQLLATLAEEAASLDALTEAVAPFLELASGETARQHLDALARRGLVSAEGDVYSLTEPGRGLLASLASEVQTTRGLTVAGLTEGDYERTIIALETMIGNLEQSA
jgi:DNA-binding MarR family transcriptional regulator